MMLNWDHLKWNNKLKSLGMIASDSNHWLQQIVSKFPKCLYNFIVAFLSDVVLKDEGII